MAKAKARDGKACLICMPFVSEHFCGQADHERKALEAGGRSSTQGFGDGGRSSTQGLGDGRPGGRSSSQTWEAGGDHQRKASEAVADHQRNAWKAGGQIVFIELVAPKTPRYILDVRLLSLFVHKCIFKIGYPTAA